MRPFDHSPGAIMASFARNLSRLARKFAGVLVGRRLLLTKAGESSAPTQTIACRPYRALRARSIDATSMTLAPCGATRECGAAPAVVAAAAARERNRERGARTQQPSAHDRGCTTVGSPSRLESLCSEAVMPSSR